MSVQMDEKHDQLNSQLTLSRNNSLAIIKSGLVKRGLELSNEIKKRHVRVLIGDHSWENVGPVISDYIQKQLSQNYDLQFKWAWYCEEILEFAEKRAIEIYILFLNNLRINRPAYGYDRIENSLKLISQIREEYGRPVIGLYSTIGDSFVAEAKSVSDFFFMIPFKLDELMIAFDKCLKMLPEFGETEASQYLQER
jgi:hypothetical protein